MPHQQPCLSNRKSSSNNPIQAWLRPFSWLWLVPATLLAPPALLPLSAQTMPVDSPAPASTAKVAQLVSQGEQQLEERQFDAALSVFQQARQQARQLGDRPLEGKALWGLGAAYLGLFDPEQAMGQLQQSLAIARQLPDRELEGRSLNHLGRAFQALQQYPKARDAYQQAIALFRAIPNHDLEADALGNLGSVYENQDDYPAATATYQQQLTIAQTGSNPKREAEALLNLSSLYRDLEDYPKAISQGDRALAIAQKIANRHLEAVAQNELGNIFYVQKNFQKALALYQQGLTVSQTIQDHKQQIIALSNLGQTYRFILNESRKALEFYQQALTIAQATHNHAAEAGILFSLSNTYQVLNQRQQASDTYQQGIKADLASRHLACAAQGLYATGRTYAHLEEYPKALEWYQQALVVEQKQAQPQCVLEILLSIGDSYNALKDHAKAIEIAQQSLTLARQLQDAKTEFNILAYGLGKAYYVPKDYSKAIDYYQQALKVAQTANNRKQVSIALTLMGNTYNALQDYPKAIDYYQQAVAVDRALQHRGFEIIDLNQLASAYSSLKNYRTAIDTYQQALAVARETQNRSRELDTLNEMGLAYKALQDYPKAIVAYQQALAVARALNAIQDETIILRNLGEAYGELKQEAQAIAYYQQAVQVAHASQDQSLEADTLFHTGFALGFNLGKWPQGIEFFQQALKLARAIQDHDLEARSQVLIGLSYNYMGDVPKGIQWLQQALANAKATQNLEIEGMATVQLGSVALIQGDFEQAIVLSQQGLEIAQGKRAVNGQTLRDRSIEGLGLVALGGAYAVGKDDYRKALELLPQGLAIARDIKDQYLESLGLTYLGYVYFTQSDYPKSLEALKQSLTIAQENHLAMVEFVPLSLLSSVYSTLGDYANALAVSQQGLTIARNTQSHLMEGLFLLSLGNLYNAQGDSQKTIDLTQQAIQVFEISQSPVMQSAALSSLSTGYSGLKQYDRAIAATQAALEINRRLHNRSGESGNLATLGYLDRQQGQYAQAIAHYQAALAADPTPELPGSGASARTGLARVYRKLNLPNVAIAYYKQAVSGIEEVRRKLVGLPLPLQQSFLQAGRKGDTISDTYRELADLLLSQGRVLEAQSVLEKLKVQELKEFQHDRSGKTPELAFTPLETALLKQHGSLIAFGQKVYQCRQTRCPEWSQLNKELTRLTEEYNDSIQGLDREIRQRRSQDKEFFDPEDRAKLLDIVEAQPGTVFIYPLVMQDKVWLVWAAAGGVIQRVEVSVTQQQFAQTVLEFRQLVQDPRQSTRKVQAVGKQLYTWLIQPLESELKTNHIQHLVFALDRVSRYIPMSALFDGEKYLIERYTIATVLSASQTNLQKRLPPGTKNTSVLALGASEFKDFSPLPNVPAELNSIVRQHPNDRQGIYPGQAFLNRAFSLSTLEDNLLGHQILHIATHAAFVPGRPEASYLVLGTGEKLTIPQIKALQDLRDVNLVVLSACETALGETLQSQDGIEISGISAYFMRGGAAAVLASLWSVDDNSTSYLMRQFYSTLAASTAQTPVTKAEALRQAQLSLLFNAGDSDSGPDRGLGVRDRPQPGSPTGRGRSDLSHPYYWAPFVLIGNGL